MFVGGGKKGYMAVLRYWPWNESAEPGDIMVSHDGRAWRLYQSNGRGKRALGELSMRELKKPGHRADIKEGKLVWIASAEFEEARLRINQQPHGVR
jgi:hypothetical protein